MFKRILVLIGLLLVGPAYAADNYAATAGSGLTFAAKSVGGILFPWSIPANSSGTELFTTGNAGYVQFPSAQAVTLTSTTITGNVAFTAALNAMADGSLVTLGAKADAKSTATDTTAITIMQVMKEISAMEQAPVSRAVTNAGTFATQSAITAASGSIASGAVASGAFASGSVASGAFAPGSLAAGSMVDLLTMRGTIANGTAAANSMAVGGVYNSSPLTLTNTQQSALQLDANGYLAVNIKAGASSGAVAQGSTTSGQTGGLIQGAVTTSAPTYTTAQTNPLSLDTSGNLRVSVSNTNPNGSAVSASSAPVVIASDQAAVAIKNAGTFAVQAGPGAAATGGWTPKHIIAANSDNATNLKNSAGTVHAIQVFGIGSAPAYLKFYNKASSPTCGSDAVIKSIMIPAAPTAANGNGAVVILDTAFSTGISYCVVLNIADTDDTSVAAATYSVNIDWN